MMLYEVVEGLDTAGQLSEIDDRRLDARGMVKTIDEKMPETTDDQTDRGGAHERVDRRPEAGLSLSYGLKPRVYRGNQGGQARKANEAWNYVRDRESKML